MVSVRLFGEGSQGLFGSLVWVLVGGVCVSPAIKTVLHAKLYLGRLRLLRPDEISPRRLTLST